MTAPVKSIKDAKSRDWRIGMIENAKGEPKRGLANTLHVLSGHPAWAGVLAYDDFAECVVKLKAPPVRRQDAVPGDDTGEWAEENSARTAAWFATEVGFEPSTVHVDQAVAAVAERCRCHPVRDYLRSLSWDGLARLDMMLVTYFGAADSVYARAVARRWMISAVARVMEPGCQADCMLVLESPEQGIGKSTGLEALFSKPWFADTGIAVGHKDSYQSLRRKWGYEFGELSSIKSREVEGVKNFISARVDNYRPSYGRRNRDFPRQVVFCGTTNDLEYLADRSGNRRFWPVRCRGRVDVEGIRRDRDALWGEARAHYERGEAWHVDTPELRTLCEQEQREREPTDPWVDVVEAWLRLPLQISYWTGGITTAEMLTGALSLWAADIGRAEETRAGHVLRELKWTARQRRESGGRVRRYFPDPTQQEQSAPENGRDKETALEQPPVQMSLPSQPNAHTHENRGEDTSYAPSVLRRDGRDVVAGEDIERGAIESEGGGE